MHFGHFAKYGDETRLRSAERDRSVCTKFHGNTIANRIVVKLFQSGP